MTRLRFVRLALAIFCLATLAFWLPVNAVSPAQIPTFPAQGTVHTDANLRAGPGTTFAKVGVVQTGAVIEVTSCNSGCTWYQLRSKQWIAASLVDLITSKPTASPNPASTAQTPVQVAQKPMASDTANLRSGPGQQYAVVGSVAAGQVLDLVGRDAGSNWYTQRDGTWISATLVNNAPRNLPVKAAPAAKGIGVSRARLQGVYELLGFEFESGTLKDGRPRVMADQYSTIVELIGPAQQLEAATVLAFVPNDDPDEVQRIVIYMALLPSTVLPDWDAGTWLAEHLEEGVNGGGDENGNYEAAITVDGKLVKLLIAPSVGSILFSING